MRSRLGLLWLLVLGILPGCARAAPLPPGTLPVAVSVPPQAFFVERIGGPRVRVQVMIPPGSSEESYAPSPRQMVALARAALYVKVGHPAFLFETGPIDRFLASHPEIRVADMSRGMDLILKGGPEDDPEHDHEGGDPHVWVAPANARIAAQNIARALEALDPAHAGEYRANLRAFLADVDALDREVRAMLTGVTGPERRFMVYHPAWGYFAREYGLEQIAIEAGGREPSAARLIELVERGRREGVRAVFVQRGFAWKSAEVIAGELGGRVVVVDPMAYDWIGSLRQAARAFRGDLVRG